MIKERYIIEHNKLAEEWLEDNPEASEEDAYEATAEAVNEAVEEYLANQADHAYEYRKDQLIEDNY
jgi:hypothetical protein